MNKISWLMSVMILITLTIISCQDSLEDDHLTETITLSPISTVVEGHITNEIGINVLHVSESSKKWWPDSVKKVFLDSDEFGKFKKDQQLIVNVSAYTPYPTCTQGDSVYYYVRTSSVLKSRATQKQERCDRHGDRQQ